MNTQMIQNLLEQHYAQITTPENGVFRAEKQYRENPIAICYFDVNRQFLNSDFDLTEYQDRLLWRDYYAHEGPVQWNYYLYFICNSGDRSCGNLQRVRMIESDRTFARKVVVEEVDLEDMLSEDGKELPGPALSSDIATVWQHELDGVGLADVASRKPYTQVVREYLESPEYLSDRSTVVDDPTPQCESESSVGFIEELVLRQFRRFPNGQSYPLKPVNLILGPNGSGKTSLLEAIELNLCGGTSRSDGEREEADIAVKLVGQQEMQHYRPGDNSWYRTRDLSWYGTAYPTGNRVFKSFRRFNFYDSDAAYRLSESPDPTEVSNAVASLFLGREANWIEERANGLVDRFEPEMRARKREIEDLRRTVKEIQTELAAVQSALPNPNELHDCFVVAAQANGWIGVMPSGQASCAEVQQALDGIASRLSSIRSTVPWLPQISRSSLNAEIKRAKAVANEIARLDRAIEESTRASGILRVEAEAIVLTAEQAARIEPYLLEPDSGRLLGMSDAIRDAHKRVNWLSSVASKIEGIQLGRFANLAEPIDAIRHQVEAQCQTLTASRSQSSERLQQLRTACSRLQGVIAEIRASAAEFLELAPDAQFCPVCNHKHDAGGLARMLQAPSDHYGASEVLDQCVAELAEIDGQLAVANQEQRDLQALGEAAGMLLADSDSPTRALNEIIRALYTAKSDLAQSEHALSDLRAVSDSFHSKGLAEEGYAALLAWFEKNKETAPVDLSSIERFSESRSGLIAMQRELADAERKHERDMQSLATERETRLAEYSGSTDETASVADVNTRTVNLEESLSSVSEIALRFRISADDTISGIERRTQELRNALQRLEAGLERLSTYAASQPLQQRKLQEAHARLSSLEPMERKLSGAISVLKEIGGGQTKQEYLTNLEENNRGSITSIFRRVHSPREFTDVRFGGDGVTLVREDSSECDPLTRISTGQRSALALSIFLSLNDRLNSGPPYILLDDPVAHTDDLNILTFLDYLRAKAIGNKRQLFFATASQKIGNLFRMKFEGLGPEMFGIIDLTDPETWKVEQGEE